jgi:hypothetical protein
MAEALTAEDVRDLLTGGGQALKDKAFVVLRALCELVSATEEDPNVSDLILRALEHRDTFGPSAEVLDGLLRAQGLFPYLAESSGELSGRDAMAFEFHRADNLPEIVFHRPQASIYYKLINRHSVALSAPTSFGKSLLIDAVIASGVYKNIVMIVPTLALIDEARRRLSERFSPTWKIITHPSQAPRERNVYILTAERVIEFEDFPEMDFFILDEFYKLSPNQHDDRCTTLNQAFLKLLKKATPFYLLGPNIRDVVPEALKDRQRCEFIVTDYKTVASDTFFVDPGKDDISALVALVKELRDPTLIYCKSPPRARQVLKALLDAGISYEVPEGITPATSWLADHFHPEWSVIKGLRAGIGIHHGKLPRWLTQYQVRLFNDEALRLLICTSSLIEGVNTRAKNVVIFDKKIGTSNFDFFTFNNIRGRAGRMFEHHIGHIYLFHQPPKEQLPIVDVPAMTLDESASDALLLQADPDELAAGPRSRLDKYFGQKDLSVHVLRANADIDPARQLKLARELRSNLQLYHSQLYWKAFPTRQQRSALCDLIWNHLQERSGGGVRSSAQLSLRIGRLGETTDIAKMIQLELSNAAYVHSADEAVDNVLDFLRHWVSYNFGRYALAVDRIQRDVFESERLPAGDYSFYVGKVQHLYSDPACAALDEYGIPFQLAKRLEHRLAGDGNLDVTLEKLKNLNAMLIDPFERELLREAQSHL